MATTRWGLLAECYARARSLVLGELLVRTGASASQTSVHPAERRANVAGAFSLSAGVRAVLESARVLLIDNVLTTGATACEAAETLIAAGAARVTLIAYARALPHDPLTAT